MAGKEKVTTKERVKGSLSMVVKEIGAKARAKAKATDMKTGAKARAKAKAEAT